MRTPREFPGKHALRRSTTDPVGLGPASLPASLVGRNRHQPVSKMSAGADIYGGHVVAEERPFGLNDVLSVRRESYWLSCGRYIERNPQEAGMVTEPWSYPWSSGRYYALGEADALVTESPCSTELSPDLERRKQLWRSFLMAADAREEVVRRGDWAVGDESFRQQMGLLLGRPILSQVSRPRKLSARMG
jgi:hypothetical protein